MKILDLFCCAGGAAVGYWRAGFTDVLGIDKDAQPNYPFPFLQLDALAALRILIDTGSIFGFVPDMVHASPPCQAYSDLQKRTKRTYPDLVAPTRELLEEWGGPYIIENVEGAPLRDPIVLCGANDEAFPQLRVKRHRLFESNLELVGTPCPARHPLVFTHDKRKAHYGKLDQDTAYVQVTGGGNCTVKNAKAAMGIDWMTKDELNEAIPPAYTEFIGQQAIRQLTVPLAA